MRACLYKGSGVSFLERAIIDYMEGTQHLRSELAEARRRTDELFSIVRQESMYERPIPERHRLNFYLGHVEAFDWNMVCRYGLSIPAFNSEYDELFAFGIDPDSSGLPADKASDWPSLQETGDYNRRVRETMDRVIEDAPPQLLHVAIEHRLMHAETLCYLLHNLGNEHKAAPRAETRSSSSRPRSEMVEIPAGRATLGQRRENGFGWDNEFEELQVDVPAFSISRYKVTNGEYLDFVHEGAEPPHFWRKAPDGWLLRTMFGEIPLPLGWPVYVTHEQASGYARWRQLSLPTEVQMQRAAYGSPDGAERSYPWGESPPDRTRGNFDFAHWDPIPVDATPAGDSAFGVSQLLGNGWEWTSDLFRPLPGFAEFPFYLGYSANFFDNDHYVMKGGSPRTAAKLLRRSFRNWFRQKYKYAYASFRCVG